MRDLEVKRKATAINTEHALPPGLPQLKEEEDLEGVKSTENLPASKFKSKKKGKKSASKRKRKKDGAAAATTEPTPSKSTEPVPLTPAQLTTPESTTSEIESKPQPAELRVCEKCGKAGLNLSWGEEDSWITCGKCMNACWCSTSCRVKDFKDHKKLCNKPVIVESRPATVSDACAQWGGLHKKSQDDAHHLLVHSYRFRRFEESVLLKEDQRVYAGLPPMNGFILYLDKAARDRQDVLPWWWDKGTWHTCCTLAKGYVFKDFSEEELKEVLVKHREVLNDWTMLEALVTGEGVAFKAGASNQDIRANIRKMMPSEFEDGMQVRQSCDRDHERGEFAIENDEAEKAKDGDKELGEARGQEKGKGNDVHDSHGVLRTAVERLIEELDREHERIINFKAHGIDWAADPSEASTSDEDTVS